MIHSCVPMQEDTRDRRALNDKYQFEMKYNKIYTTTTHESCTNAEKIEFNEMIHVKANVFSLSINENSALYGSLFPHIHTDTHSFSTLSSINLILWMYFFFFYFSNRQRNEKLMRSNVNNTAFHVSLICIPFFFAA